jgi:O-antigen/teichoic acid export membrane protein
MSILKKLAGETAIYGLSSIVGRFLNYLLVPLYTGIFKPGEYGVSTEFYAYASFLAVFFTYGMETAFFRFYQKQENKEEVFSTAFGSVSLSALVFGSVITLMATPLAAWTHNVGREQFFIYLAFILAVDAITTLPFAWLRQQGQAKKFASLRLLNIATNIGLNLFFYKIMSYKSISYMFIANLVSSVIVLPFFFQEIKLLRFGINRELWKEMFKFALPIIFMGLAGMVNETIDRILLKQLIVNQADAEHQIGVYGANYKLAILITLFIQAFRFAAEPFFFSRMKDENAKVTYAKVMNYFVIVCSTIFLFVLLYLDVLKYFIRNESFWKGLKVVPILLFANICLGIYYNLSIWYKLTNKTQLGAVVAFIGAFITLILNYLWIPKYGYMGSAWATLICYASMVMMSYIQGKKHYPVPYQIGKIAVYLGAALAIYAFTLLFTASISNLYLKLSIHTLLLFFYVGAIVFLEMKGFKKMLQH